MLEVKELNSSTELPQDKPGFLKVFFAPWLGVVRPTAAADILANSSRLAFCVTFTFWAYFLAGAILLLALWGGTIAHTFVATNAGGFTAETHIRTIAQVWHDWHQISTITPAELILIFTPPCTLVLATILAWLLLPTHPNEKPIATWIANAIRRVSACGGVLVLTVGAIGFTWVFILHIKPDDNVVPRIPFVLPVLFLLGPWILIYFAALTLKEIGKTDSVTLTSPICEDCGYNLFHQPIDGKCPECGTLISESVINETRRIPLPWPKKQRLGSWLWCTNIILLKPNKFYSRLQMNGPSHSARNFAVWHYLAIVICSAIWMIIESTTIGDPNIGLLFTPVALTIYPLIGWITHRFVGALSATIWLMRGELPNPHVLPKAFYYETPFLWVFCVYNGIIGTSIINGNWLFEWIGIVGMFGLPFEELAVLAGNVLLVLIWLWRFGRVLKAVRWANF